MRKVFILLALIALTKCTVNETPTLGDDDFYKIQDCPNFSNAQYVANLDLKFDELPRSGHLTHVSLIGNIANNFYIAYIRMTARFNGIKLVDQKLKFNEQFVKGDPYSKKLLMPSAIMPAGVISGEGRAFNELGEMVQCYTYSIQVLPHSTENDSQ